MRRDVLVAAWGLFLGRIPWTVFVTLTFDPRRAPDVSAVFASRECFRWCGVVAYALRRPIGWAYAVERGRGGRWHAHVLMAGANEALLAALLAVWEGRNGRADVRPVGSRHGAALYTSKDVALGGEVVLSDTLLRYRSALAPEVVVDLFPEAREGAAACSRGETR